MTTWEAWLEVLRLVLVPLVGYIAYLLREMNDRLVRLEQWQVDHSRDIDRRLTRIERAMDNTPRPHHVFQE